MKKNVLLLSILALSAFSSFSQIKLSEAKNMADSLSAGYWDKRNTQFGINFAQAGFNDAWANAQGSVNSFALGFIFNNHTGFHKKKGIWTSDIQFQYGYLKNKGQERNKSVDRIFLDTKYASKLTPKINWFVGANFLSQFAAGYTTTNSIRKQVSSILAPGFLSEGVGLEWKPVKYFALQLGGATLRQTFVNNDVVFNNTKKSLTEDGKQIDRSYGTLKGKVLNEMGFQAVAVFDKDILPNLNLKWRYQGFVAYAPKTKPIDHNINLIATAKVNKFMNVNFTLLGNYDEDIVSKFQLSEGLAVGVLFTL